MKYTVQARWFRKTHSDAHYASALFRCQREFAVKFKTYTTFLCVDDKHRAKVYESLTFQLLLPKEVDVLLLGSTAQWR